MPGNRSLDEFAGGGRDDGADEEPDEVEAASDDRATEPDEVEAASDDGADEEPDEVEAASDESGEESPGEGPATETTAAGPATGRDDDPAVEPLAETYAWSAAGGDCAGCGETVAVRWRDGDRLVCEACKAW